jgi:uncharacterized protein (DUF1697 family)
MTLVVFLRGVNVGGHRTFRPSQLAAQLKHLDCVNIGAAGTFVIRKPVPLTQLRAELARLLPFETAVAICHGKNVTELVANSPFSERTVGRDVVRFVSILPNKTFRVTPVQLPGKGKWLVRVLGQRERFVFGEYRRHLKTIGYLGKLDRHFGATVTTRNWNTICAIARVLEKK